MQLTGKQLNTPETLQVSKFLHCIGDFERLGDHAVNISNVAGEIADKKITFSDEADRELEILLSANKEIVDLTVKAFCEDDIENAARIEPLRELIGILCGDLKTRHVARLRSGACEMKHGYVFNDLLTNVERIAAHCSNVGVAIIETDTEEFDPHEYLKSVRGMKNETYRLWFDEYAQKYDVNQVRKKGKKAEKNK